VSENTEVDTLLLVGTTTPDPGLVEVELNPVIQSSCEAPGLPVLPQQKSFDLHQQHLRFLARLWIVTPAFLEHLAVVNWREFRKRFHQSTFSQPRSESPGVPSL